MFVVGKKDINIDGSHSCFVVWIIGYDGFNVIFFDTLELKYRDLNPELHLCHLNLISSFSFNRIVLLG